MASLLVVAAESPSSYPLSQALRVRTFGWIAVLTGACLVGWILLESLDVWGAALLLGLMLCGLALGVWTGLLLVLRPAVLRVDDRGFTVRRVIGTGPRQGAWTDVTRVGTQHTARGPLMVMMRGDSGEPTRVPLWLLDAPPVDVEQEVRRRLDRAHGLTPLNE